MAGERLTKIEAAAREVERFIGAQYDRDTALRLAAAAIRALASPPPSPAAAEAPRREGRCSVCGSARIRHDDGSYGACTLVPGRDGKGGCPAPLRDFDAEQTQPAPAPPQAEPAPEAKGGACPECKRGLDQYGSICLVCGGTGRAGRGERHG